VKPLASVRVRYREIPAPRIPTPPDRAPFHSHWSRRRTLIFRVAGVLLPVIASAFIAEAILPGKHVVQATLGPYADDQSATHVVIEGLHIAIPNHLPYLPIDQLIPRP
jgi:predicted anti-sigma-YlaC factor YlaD